MEYFIVVICVIIALVIGYLIGVHLTIDNFVQGYLHVDDFVDNYEQESEWISLRTGKVVEDTHKISIYIEIVDDILYAYESKTNKYMAHGITREEFENVLISNYPNTLFGMTEENLREVGFIQ